MNNLTDHRTHEVRVITGVIAIICATACATSIIPGLEDLINRALLIGAAVVLLGVAARLGVRWVRERLEDREDDRLAVIWRAEHAARIPSTDLPVIVTPVGSPRLRVVVSDVREVA